MAGLAEASGGSTHNRRNGDGPVTQAWRGVLNPRLLRVVKELQGDSEAAKKLGDVVHIDTRVGIGPTPEELEDSPLARRETMSVAGVARLAVHATQPRLSGFEQAFSTPEPDELAS